MTALCPTYVVPNASQLKQGGATGPYDCTAWAARVVIATSTCGAKVPSGRTIRLQSSEPIPDPTSPGLNLNQVAAVARDHYGVYMDVHTGLRKVTWDEYERRRKAGQPAEIQVSYAPIADSKYDAGRGFRGGHAMAETTHATYDSLADGRAAGVFKFNGMLYTRELMKQAAGKLVIGQTRTGPRLVGYGYVWAAFGRDVVPSFRVRVPAGPVLVYSLMAGKVVDRRTATTAGFTASCSPPRSYPWPAKSRTVTLVKVTGGSHAGWYISAKYATEA